MSRLLLVVGDDTFVACSADVLSLSRSAWTEQQFTDKDEMTAEGDGGEEQAAAAEEDVDAATQALEEAKASGDAGALEEVEKALEEEAKR